MKDYYDERLHEMLRYKRPHDSRTELEWVDKFILRPYEGMAHNIDNMAWVIEIPLANGNASETLFSCHVDTVHRTEGRQRVKFNKQTMSYYKDDGECLGADDTAGCWLMLEMIDRGIAGTYVFHRGEERGGIGSTHLSKVHADWLTGFKRAIAFDRRGGDSVITHQGWGRCCSDKFGVALADALNTSNELLMYSPDDTGIFTDTANYVDLIPECTNLSCGYDHEHTGKETLNVVQLFELRNALFCIDFESLPTARDPLEIDDSWDTRYSSKYGLASYDYGYSRPELTTNDLYRMSRSQMIDLAYEDPELFVALVREELLGEYEEPVGQPAFKTKLKEY